MGSSPGSATEVVKGYKKHNEYIIRPLVVRTLAEDIRASMHMFSSYLKTLISQGGL